MKYNPKEQPENWTLPNEYWQRVKYPELDDIRGQLQDIFRQIYRLEQRLESLNEYVKRCN